MSSLIEWTMSRMSALYSPQHSSAENTDTDASAQLQTQFDSTFAADAEIHLNHTLVDYEQFKEFVKSRRTESTEVECKPEDFIETPVEEGNADSGSIVAGKVTLVRTHKFRIRVGRAKTTTVISFSAKIKQTPEPRIVQLFQTSVDKPFQVNLNPRAVDASAL
ncbi:hypothetical protein MSAN_00550500 [Mycena sanguinolenta]|uniref:Uncharacterized protein n=1 Tax=Mycena sanguinolenta TaxID=230812 RepID=A0A8H6Z9F2_9AGAR|nr:hypothetical protein MSAN_00550500 [Mycena sanguinolenta]